MGGGSGGRGKEGRGRGCIGLVHQLISLFRLWSLRLFVCFDVYFRYILHGELIAYSWVLCLRQPLRNRQLRLAIAEAFQRKISTASFTEIPDVTRHQSQSDSPQSIPSQYQKAARMTRYCWIHYQSVHKALLHTMYN